MLMTCQYFFMATAARECVIALQTASHGRCNPIWRSGARLCEPQHVARPSSGDRPGFVKAPDDRQGCCRSQARALLEMTVRSADGALGLHRTVIKPPISG